MNLLILPESLPFGLWPLAAIAGAGAAWMVRACVLAVLRDRTRSRAPLSKSEEYVAHRPLVASFGSTGLDVEVEALAALLDAGVPVDIGAGEEPGSLLYCACKSGSTNAAQVVRLLLQSGAEVNAADQVMRHYHTAAYERLVSLYICTNTYIYILIKQIYC